MIRYNSQDRLVTQFKNKPVFKALLDSFVDVSLDEGLSDLLNKRDLETAQGIQLDGIGDIVGIARPYTLTNQDGVFGFLEDVLSGTFGDINNPTTGEFFDTLTPKPVNRVNDDIYRFIIKAKILQNYSNFTVDSTLKILNLILQTNVKYYGGNYLSPIYYINRILESYEIEIVKKINTVFGIKVLYIMNVKDNAFGFLEDETAGTFNNLREISIGANFASIL